MRTTIDILFEEGLVRHKVEALFIGGYSLPAYGVMLKVWTGRNLF
jgi:hypothetical protein